ncbi:MAG: c-type cytochrome [Bacteroidia bacterium]|nr:c-type cytochrome [Bacteroidia bacterium]
MIHVFNRVSKIFAALFMVFMTVGGSFAQDGEALFKSNCARCHYASDKKLVGPGLAGVRSRWSSEDNLHAWIVNSTDYLKTGDSYATDLFEKFNKSVMPGFPNLKKEEVTAILDYIDKAGAAPAGGGSDSTAVAGGGAGAQGGDSGNTLMYVLIVVILILSVLIYALYKISVSLTELVKQREGDGSTDDRTFLDKAEDCFRASKKWAGENKAIVGVAIFVGLCFVLKLAWDGLMGIGVYQGYQPHQPIKFSHAKHAGELKIACEYCHTGVKESRHATIPSSSTCMNCHKAVSEGPLYGKNEIAKIYASIGFDPNKGAYIDNYNNQDKEQVLAVYEEWLGGDNDAFRAVEQYVQKPIDWVQIHKLPDHAYFNHAQHYRVGGVECQTCHGKVEEMEEVKQFAPLTMGWCINCHRETKVKFEENPYYDKLHDYLAERYKKGDQFTVARIGGLECGKCHY